jgi:hypothetical protein
MVPQIGHFIDGKHVVGTSGRFADVNDPSAGGKTVTAHWPSTAKDGASFVIPTMA